MKITQLTQPTKYSCATTCVAMLLGHDSPDEMVAKHHIAYFEEGKDILDILKEEGIKFRTPSRNDVSTLYPGCTYLASVPSLNIPGGMHQVIFSLTEMGSIIVYDPAKGRKGRKHYSSAPYVGSDINFPSSWFIDARILNIDPPEMEESHEMAGRVLWGMRQDDFKKDHDQDFEEFLRKYNAKRS